MIVHRVARDDIIKEVHRDHFQKQENNFINLVQDIKKKTLKGQNEKNQSTRQTVGCKPMLAEYSLPILCGTN